MIINRQWAMPNKWTFQIPPIAELLVRYVGDGKGWIDPFAGMTSPAEFTNDINPKMPTTYHLHAIKFCELFRRVYYTEMKTVNLLPKTKEMLNRPFAERLQEAQYFIAHNISLYKHPAVAWSGGKDSTLVLWLCLKLKPDILAVFNNTGVEYPETVKFIHQLRDEWRVNLIETQPTKSFWDIVAVKGFMNRSKQSHGSHGGVCCADLKEYPMERAQRQYQIDAVFTGTTAPESRQRQFSALKYGACYTYKKTGIRKVHPILWWTEDEVKQYHTDMGIPLNPMYFRGCDRVGCMPCTAFKTWESQLSQTNPKLYRLLKLRKDKQYVMELIKG